MTDPLQIDAAMAALEAQRPLLGDEVVDAALAGLRQRKHTTALASSDTHQPLDQVRKQVSILFLDVVSSTRLSQCLDPEDIHGVMDGCLQRCTAVVLAHGGQVLQYAGDSLLAAFGARQAQEDDAERAVQCGLALLLEGRVLAARVLRDHAVDGCDVRVGIHTGTVLLGGGVDGAGTMRGVAVNLAARMEQSAPAGGLRISQDTWQLVRGLFDAVPQPPLAVKGFDAPVASWLVQRARPRSFHLPQRGIEGLDTPLAGRREELGKLLDVVRGSAAGNQLHAVTLLADPGLGKSRLLLELQAALPDCDMPVQLLQSRAHPQCQLQAYGLLRDLVLGWACVADGEVQGLAVAQLQAVLAPLFTEGSTGPQAIGRLIGLSYPDSADWQGVDPRQGRDLGFAALGQALRRLAQASGAAVVLMLEDLQWADDGSLDFLDQLRAAADEPGALALVMTARPALLERRSAWAGSSAPHELVRLGALSAGDSAALARDLTKRLTAGAQAVQELLCRRAEGNPFYMEELLKLLIEQGAVDTQADAWQADPARLHDSALPATLVGVLQARLDALQPAERLALQHASIVGHVFWDEALAALDPQAPAAMPQLQLRRLVLSHGAGKTQFEDAHERTFHHHLLHEVTYDTVLKAVRRLGHARAAQWLAARVGEGHADTLVVTAEHFQRAGDTPQALEFFERAARHAQSRFANTAVIDITRHALALPALPGSQGSHDVQRRIALLLLQEEAADLAGLPDVADRSNDALADCASAAGDEGLACQVLINRARQASRRGEDPRALKLARDALALAERLGDAPRAVSACFRMAHCHYLLGAMVDCSAAVETGLTWVARALPEEVGMGLRQDELQLLNYRAAVKIGTDDLPGALVASEAALTRAQAIGSQRLEALSLNTLAGTQANLCLTEQALQNLARAAELSKALNWPLLESFALYNRAACLRIEGQFDAALQCVDEALAICRRIQLRQHAGRCAMQRGSLLLDRGDFAQALLAFDEAAEFVADDDAPYQCQLQARRALAHWAAGDRSLALQLVDQVACAIDQGVLLAGTEEPLFAPGVCARLWRASQDPRAPAQVARVRAQMEAELACLRDPADRERVLRRMPPYRDIVAELGVSD